MKALLMKDLYVFWRRMKLFVLMIVVFCAVPSVFQNTFAITYAAMIPYSMFSVDESSKWDKLAAMMPYSTFDLVMSKYLLGGLSVGASFTLVTLMQFITARFSESTGADFSIVLASVCVSLIIMAVTLPMIFRFGVERARMTMIFLIAAVCGSAGAMASLTDAGVSISFAGAAALLPVAAVVTMALSIPLSIKLYEKRKG